MGLGKAQKCERNLAKKRDAYKQKEEASKNAILNMEDNRVYQVEICGVQAFRSGAFWKDYYKAYTNSVMEIEPEKTKVLQLWI